MERSQAESQPPLGMIKEQAEKDRSEEKQADTYDLVDSEQVMPFSPTLPSPVPGTVQQPLFCSSAQKKHRIEPHVRGEQNPQNVYNIPILHGFAG